MEYPQRSYQFNLATYISRDDFIKFHPMTDHVEFMPVKTGQYPLPRPASPSPTSRRKISARSFHHTGILAPDRSYLGGHWSQPVVNCAGLPCAARRLGRAFGLSAQGSKARTRRALRHRALSARQRPITASTASGLSLSE